MKLNRERLRPISTPLVGFAGERVQPMGVISLPVPTAIVLKQSIVMLEFLVAN